MSRVIDNAALASLFVAVSYVAGYAYLGAIKSAVLAMLR